MGDHVAPPPPPCELSLPGSLEDALSNFPLLKPISPDLPPGLGRWKDLEMIEDGETDESAPSVSDAGSDHVGGQPHMLEQMCDEPHLPTNPSSSALWTTSTDPMQQEGVMCVEASIVDDDPSVKKAMTPKQPWTRHEDAQILEGVKVHGHKWSKIASMLPVRRTDDAVRNRWHRLRNKADRLAHDSPSGCDDTPTKKPRSQARLSPASAEGVGDAMEEGGKHGDMWTAEEDLIIDHAVRVRGLRWKAIAELLPGRTESGCRNRWVRSQERVFAAAGLHVHGAAAVFAALDAARQKTLTTSG